MDFEDNILLIEQSEEEYQTQQVQKPTGTVFFCTPKTQNQTQAVLSALLQISANAITMGPNIRLNLF